MIKYFWLLILLLGLSAADKQTEDFSALAVGADAMGRGGAYYAASDSNQPLFQNYAFLNSQQQPRLAMSAFQMLNNLNYLTASVAFGNFAFGALHISDSSGYLRDERNNRLGGQIGYNDTTAYAALGWSNEYFGLGARFKYLSKTYTGLDVSAAGTALDLAGFGRLGFLTAGFVFNNLSGSGLLWTTGVQEALPSDYGLGLKAQVLDNVALYTDVNLADGDTLVHAGVEFKPPQILTLRLGLSQYVDFNANNEKIIDNKMTFGLGFNFRNLYLDYAYNPGRNFSDNITHYITLAWRFGVTPVKKRSVASRQELPEQREDAEDEETPQKVKKVKRTVTKMTETEKTQIEQLSHEPF